MANIEWIIYFAEDWKRHSSTSQYLAEELVRRYKILWVNSLGLRAPHLTTGDGKRVITKLYQFAASLVRHRTSMPCRNLNKIYIASPLAIPLLRYRMIRTINQLLVLRYLDHTRAALGINAPIVITAAIESVDIIDKLGALAKVYYCADEYSTMPKMDRELVRSLELELINKVDLVVATSTKLQQVKSRYHNNVIYLPHGVAYSKFRKALNHKLEVPPDLRPYKGPLIGFVGLLGEHIDYPLIKGLAENLSDASIILIGPVEEGIELPRNRAIKHIGPKPHDELLYYLARFDVCIIPYRTDMLRIQFANPTKLYEYLAAGCPVVSTPQPEAKKMADYIDFAANKEEFINAVRRILKQGGKKSREELSTAMRFHSWESRAESLVLAIEQLPVLQNYSSDSFSRIGFSNSPD